MSNTAINDDYEKKPCTGIIYPDHILGLQTRVYRQDRFLPHCHSNRPGSSEDTLMNSSFRSNPVMGSLLN